MTSMNTSVCTVDRSLKRTKLLAKMAGVSCHNLGCPECGAKVIRE